MEAGPSCEIVHQTGVVGDDATCCFGRDLDTWIFDGERTEIDAPFHEVPGRCFPLRAVMPAHEPPILRLPIVLLRLEIGDDEVLNSEVMGDDYPCHLPAHRQNVAVEADIISDVEERVVLLAIGRNILGPVVADGIQRDRAGDGLAHPHCVFGDIRRVWAKRGDPVICGGHAELVSFEITFSHEIASSS